MHTSGTMIPTSSVLTFPVKNCFLQRNRFSVSVYESYKHKLIIWKIFEYCLSSTSLWYMYVFSIYHFVRWYFGLNLWGLQFKYVQCIFLPNDCTSYEWWMETNTFASCTDVQKAVIHSVDIHYQDCVLLIRCFSNFWRQQIKQII